MKKTQTLKSCGLLVTALMAGSCLVFAQTSTTNLNSFSSTGNSEGVAPIGCGTGYGAGLIQWDNQDEPAGIGLYPGTTGAGYLTVGYSTSDTSDHALENYICFGQNQQEYYFPGGPTVDLSLYSAVQFDILWDTVNSSVSINNFNNPTNLGFGSSSYPGLQVDFTAESGGNTEGDVGTIGFGIPIPDAASNGWQTITVPIPATLSDTAGFYGIILGYWLQNEGPVVTALEATNFTPTAYFWIANVNLIGTAGPPPPPKLQAPFKPTPGLNIFASTEGNTYYDRQEVGLVASNGVSWVGYASAANPVTYSFTINSFPQNPATEYACEAYMMMSPNPAAYDNAIDYNEPDCVIVYLQQGAGTTQMNFQYKLNTPNSEAFTTIGTVTNSGTALGTWGVTFTSPTNVMMTAPNGSTSSFIFTNGTAFAETGSPGMYLYLGMQANNAASLDQAVCYSKFSISGVSAAMSDNFLADSTLNPTNWFNFMGHAPIGSFVMPPSAEDWVTWTVPYAGFQFQYATSVLGPWTVLHDTNDITMPAVGEVLQLITTNDIPAGTQAAYFDLASP